jgi:hypothetical protein
LRSEETTSVVVGRHQTTDSWRLWCEMALPASVRGSAGGGLSPGAAARLCVGWVILAQLADNRMENAYDKSKNRDVQCGKFVRPC